MAASQGQSSSSAMPRAPMLPRMATLKSEMQKAVNGLHPNYEFDIIFFQDGKCIALDQDQMVPADAAHRRWAAKFLDEVTTTGTADPIAGVSLAFDLHPQLIYLLSGGHFADNKAIKAKIAELNRDHKVKVNTIAFAGNQDAGPDFLAHAEGYRRRERRGIPARFGRRIEAVRRRAG